MSSTQPPPGPPSDPSGTSGGQPGGTPPPPPPPPATPAGGYGQPAGGYGQPPGGYNQSAAGYGQPPVAGGVGQPGTLVDRFVARLVDLIICGVVAGIISVILAAIADNWFVANLITAVVEAAIFLGYFSYLESNRGQTLGKQLMKLKVFGPDGQSLPTMEQAVRRNLWTGVAILNVIPILGAFLGFVIYVVAVIVCAVNINGNPDRRTWFDRFAGGTQVVKIG